MDFATIINGYLRSKGLAQGPTLQGIEAEGRFDVLASAAVEALASGNPIIAVTHSLLRPQIDGVLVEHLGPVKLQAQLGRYVSDFEAAAALAAGSKLAEKELNKRGIATRSHESRSKAGSKSANRQAASAPKGAKDLERKGNSIPARVRNAKGAKRRAAPAKVEDVIDLEPQADGTYA